jgi:hypothetical protein
MVSSVVFLILIVASALASHHDSTQNSTLAKFVNENNCTYIIYNIYHESIHLYICTHMVMNGLPRSNAMLTRRITVHMLKTLKLGRKDNFF